MKIYFLSARTCALSLNGVYFGLTDRFERFAEIDLADNVFAEFLPENAQPIRFFINDRLPFVPPAGCEVYLLPDGLAVFARDFIENDRALRVIAQERFDSGLITVFSQGTLQVSLETHEGFFISHLPPAFSVCKLSLHVGLFFIEGENCLAVYTAQGECALLEEVMEFSVTDNTLHATLPLSDSLGRIAKCAWALRESGCERTECTLVQTRTASGETEPDKIAEELLPYAFFESLLLGVNCADLLSDELAGKADVLASFLGDFKAVTLTEDPCVCGLVYQKAERLFEVRRFTVKTENGKIIDVIG